MGRNGVSGPGRGGIRARTFTTLALTLGFGIGVLVLTLRGFLLSSFERGEKEQVRQAFAEVENRIEFLLEELAAKSAHYAASDRPGVFFPGALLAAETLPLAAVVDGDGALIDGAALNPALSGNAVSVAPTMGLLIDNPALRAPQRLVTPVRGLVRLGDRPLLLLARPIVRRGAAGSTRATLLLGRFLDLSQRRAAPGGAGFEVLPVPRGGGLSGEAGTALAALAEGEDVFVRRQSAQVMTGYLLLRDIGGGPAFLVRLNLERSGYAAGLLSLKVLLAAFVVVLAATGGIYLLLLERTVLRRVIRLGGEVQRVGAGAAPAATIVPDGADEIGRLAEQVREAFESEQLLKREVEEARRALERRVEERTTELRLSVDALHREVGVRREAEEQVRALERQQRAVIDHMVGGLVTFDEGLLVTRVNPAAQRLLRATESAIGRCLDQVLPAAFAADVAAAFAGGEETVDRREIRGTFADGRELVVGYVLSRVPPGEGRGAQGIVVFRDLTDERRLAEQQQRLNRLTTLGEFSAQVAHELRNPLTAMSSSVQYLAAASDGRERELLRIITESIGRMEGIIRRLRLLSREMPQARARVDLGELVSHLLLFLEASLRAQRVTARFRPPTAAPVVVGDPAQLHQALLNLLMNAMQAMPGGGTLRVRLTRGRAPAGGGPPPAMIVIADTGCGIAPEVAGRIFDPFYTTREAGTGLGLPIADKIVREHGGTIRYTSRQGRGTTFAVLLPAAGD